MKNISKIIRLARPLFGILSVSALMILIVSLIGLATPLFSKAIVDTIVEKVSGKGADLTRLYWLIGGLFSINVFGVIITAVSERLGDHIAGELRRFLTQKYYHKVLTLQQSYFDSNLSGKLVNQLNRGILTIMDFVNTCTNFILPQLLTVVLVIGLMAYYNIYIAAVTFLLFPIYLWISNYSTKVWGLEEGKKNKIEDVTRGRISEVIGNIKLVKGFTTEKLEYQFVHKNLGKINEIYARQSVTFHTFDFYRNLSLQVIILIVNIIAFYSAFIGKLTIGEMVLIIQLINMARAPLFAMSFILERVQQAEQGSKEYFEVMELPSVELFDEPDEKPFVVSKHPSIEFKDVSFKYDESDMVLSNISFKLNPNETVALVGHSGVGKSTIVSLILKFYQTTKGEIYLDGKSYSELPHRDIRRNIALVYQDNELFSSTIGENVAYGKKDASEKDVINALKLANAYDFVKKLPAGISSEIGERGVRLSGGQKQRIQIARAIMKNAPVLILDEATSSLDAKSEREVQEGLENLMKDRLTMIIAHRFSTIQNVDKIIVIDKGGIVDMGTPKELATRPGVYSELLKYQVEGNKKLLAAYDIY